ncbi:hypothetical protein ASG67_14425 [Sphingomonas sp. Leaf339]|uniref:LuxR C-terminal-related transcriptional regulator n=1 Tax=Sphingomonas sp. Leaf339 TaxID=1736343 RepID=UPI0006F5ED3A|nr:LuxR C-terminal-related transcriptional regulator [Sphingomonas sp. Leaf339]KQU47443.1 hypothetical protein ASG67_14425 [Sphingomonas sp. Leaf339]
MHPGLDRLSARERDALRLLAQGFDAKSAAQRLGMSVHTLNDRLRGARQKLGVSSSREAARLLAESDRLSPETAAPDPPPDLSAPQEIGLAAPPDPRSDALRPAFRATGGRRLLLLTSGFALMLLLIVTVAAFWLPMADAPPAPGTPPRVVATTPHLGTTIAAGPFDLSVTFDRPMTGDSYSFVQFSADTYPGCAPKPALSRDRRTFTLRCTAVAGHQYQIGINGPPYMNFRDTTGISATPYRLTFSAR